MQTNENATVKAQILAARNGNQAAFETLLAQYSPLIEAMTAHYAREDALVEYRDDLRQEACIAFYKAVERFDLAQEDVQFGLFAKTCIRNRLISCLRKLRFLPGIVDWEDDSDPEADDPMQSVLEEESYRELYHRIESLLSPYESRVWWLYLSGRTAREIAQRFSKDERSVQNAIYRIRKKLRASLPAP